MDREQAKEAFGVAYAEASKTRDPKTAQHLLDLEDQSKSATGDELVEIVKEAEAIAFGPKSDEQSEDKSNDEPTSDDKSEPDDETDDKSEPDDQSERETEPEPEKPKSEVKSEEEPPPQDAPDEQSEGETEVLPPKRGDADEKPEELKPQSKNPLKRLFGWLMEKEAD